MGESNYRRGNSEHYAELGRRSASGRIRRYINAPVQLMHPLAKIPTRKRESDAGYDVYAVEDYVVPAGSGGSIRTGIALRCPVGYFYRVTGRSSIAGQKIITQEPIIDATYTGEIKVVLINCGEDDFTVRAGDRIAQLVFYPQIHVDMREVTGFAPSTSDRGEAGFGSTGRRD